MDNANTASAPPEFGIEGNEVFTTGDMHAGAHIAHRKAREFCDTVLTDALEWDLSQGRVISIYGIGGEGKSFFMHDIYDHAAPVAAAYESRRVPADRARVRRVYIDFFDEDATRLSRLRKVFDAFLAQGVFCHSFCVAYHSFLHPKGEELIADGYLQDLYSCPGVMSDGSIPFLADSALGIASTALDVVSALNPIGSVRDLVEIAWEARDRRQKARAERDARDMLHAYANFESRWLLDRMPDLMISDLEEYVAVNPGERLLVIADSFEHLCSRDLTNALDQTGRFVQQLTHLPSSLWVIAGRLALRGENWDNVVCYPIELVGLSSHETSKILAQADVDDPAIVAHVQEITGGIPVFVWLYVDHIKRAGVEKRITLEKLVKDVADRESLLNHYLDGMDDHVRRSVFAMGYLREWDQELLWDVLESCVDPADAGAIVEGVETGALPFVSKRGNRYQIHEVIGSMLRSILPAERNMRRFCVSLYRTLDEMATKLQGERNGVWSGEWHARALLLYRALFDLGLQIERFSRSYRRVLPIEAIRRGRAAYIEELKWARLYAVARDALADTLSAHRGAWDEYGMRLRLDLAAMLSLLSLQEDMRPYHLRAMEIEGSVYERLVGMPDADQGLLMRVRNSLGTSNYRFAESMDEIKVSFVYHQPNYDEVCAMPHEALGAFETRCLNNYGVACLKAASLTKDAATRAYWLTKGSEAFGRAVDARMVVLGVSDNQTVLSMTNMGISRYRLAELKRSEDLFVEAEEDFDLAERWMDEADYPAGSDRRLYNAFHRALLEEGRGRVRDELGESEMACDHMREALRLHTDVSEARERYGANKIDCRKSRKCVERCQRWLCEHGAS